MNELYINQLKQRGIMPTAIRLLIFKTMLSFNQMFSMADLEKELDTIDKSTLYRTITLFYEKHLLHSVDDGSGAIKYSICSTDCTCTIKDLHVHFSCSRCGKTTCMKGISIPDIKLPPKYVLKSANFVLKGLCDKCSNIAT